MKSLVLGDLEQEILSVIWSSTEPMCVRRVLEHLRGQYAYTTIMTMMSRMEKKGLLKRLAQGKSFVYTYTEDKTRYANKHLGFLYHSLVDTYGELAISQFVDSIKADNKNIKLLEEYLESHE